MLTDDGLRVLEFNVRMGDPETQVLLAALEDDVVPALEACAEGDLEGAELRGSKAAAVVVLASEGYPRSSRKGDVIEGIDEANAVESVRVFHAGTAERDGDIIVNGGRVLGVTGTGKTPEEALKAAYEGVQHIRWPGMQYRRDIGHHLDEG
jgi:phosphoribosylamine--glycine ligase